MVFSSYSLGIPFVFLWCFPTVRPEGHQPPSSVCIRTSQQVVDRPRNFAGVNFKKVLVSGSGNPLACPLRKLKHSSRTKTNF